MPHRPVEATTLDKIAHRHICGMESEITPTSEFSHTLGRYPSLTEDFWASTFGRSEDP